MPRRQRREHGHGSTLAKDVGRAPQGQLLPPDKTSGLIPLTQSLALPPPPILQARGGAERPTPRSLTHPTTPRLGSVRGRRLRHRPVPPMPGTSLDPLALHPQH
mmetsp:Transcript_22107/g.64155  ORF Transcript_22107/g.64155 Transcript_22107/m.64155 type:complete len:104 (+) Transcript_22107:171-482(+)